MSEGEFNKRLKAYGETVTASPIEVYGEVHVTTVRSWLDEAAKDFRDAVEEGDMLDSMATEPIKKAIEKWFGSDMQEVKDK